MEKILNDLRKVFQDIEDIQNRIVRSEELEDRIELECLEHLNTSMRNVSLANNKLSKFS
tara:strand:- start:533 stop:709 length:177 start_codon:yes stop_codon:yes gene_type:complete